MNSSRPSWWSTVKRIVASISIIATFLYVMFFTLEFIHWVREKHPVGPKPGYVISMQNSIQREIDEIGSVPPSLLADNLIHDLSTHDCTWYFTCSPRPLKTIHYDYVPICPTCQYALNRTFQQEDPPALVFKIAGGAPVPTWHAIFGAPHALRITSLQIARAGPWAIIMFISCTIIYFGVALLWAARVKEAPAFMMLILIACAPFCITALAHVFEWAAAKTFHGISSAVAQVVYVIAWSSAASLLVSLPHVYKAPREILEAADLIRRV